jgi:hypothetical protein
MFPSNARFYEECSQAKQDFKSNHQLIQLVEKIKMVGFRDEEKGCRALKKEGVG